MTGTAGQREATPEDGNDPQEAGVHGQAGPQAAAQRPEEGGQGPRDDDDKRRNPGPQTEYAQKKRRRVGHTGPNLFKYFFTMSLVFLVGVRGEDHPGRVTQTCTTPNTHGIPNNSSRPLRKCSMDNALAAPLLTRDRFGDG